MAAQSQKFLALHTSLTQLVSLSAILLKQFALQPVVALLNHYEVYFDQDLLCLKSSLSKSAYIEPLFFF